MILATGCSNTSEVTAQKELETVSEDTNSIEDSKSQNKDIIYTALDLLGKNDKESESFFNGGEKNVSIDGNNLIGRIYEVDAFDDKTTLYTSYRDDGVVNSINFELIEKEVKEYRALIGKLLGNPTEINDIPSKGGSTYAMWNVEGKLIYLYKNYDSISMQLILPDELTFDKDNEYTLSNTIKNVMAKTESYPELESLIISEYDIPTEYFGKTKYYYNYVDLNSDGKEEIFVVIMGPYTSGSGGSSAMIVYPVDDKLNVNQKFTLIQTPIIISDQIANGAKEIISYKSGGGSESGYVKLTCSDGYYTTINDGEPIKTLDDISGTAIIANDLISDIVNNNFLTLKK